MKIIDNIIFCNTHEKELLLLKLIIEHEYVDKFFITECAYDYRGCYKGQVLEKMLKEDVRFTKFLDKIQVISIPTNLSVPQGTFSDKDIDPQPFSNAEASLRNAATVEILHNFADQDRIFVSDIDEVIDFSDSWRREELFKNLYKHEKIQFDRIRYWYDFDNRGMREKLDCITPAFSVGSIRRKEAALSNKKWVGHPVGIKDNKPLIFEYSFCFDRAGIDYKFGTSLHTCWTKENIDVSLLCNHWTMTNYQKIDFNNRWQWFEKVELTENNSPEYVRENLTTLKTNLVPDNYRQNRLQFYGFVANWPIES